MYVVLRRYREGQVLKSLLCSGNLKQKTWRALLTRDPKRHSTCTFIGLFLIFLQCNFCFFISKYLYRTNLLFSTSDGLIYCSDIFNTNQTSGVYRQLNSIIQPSDHITKSSKITGQSFKQETIVVLFFALKLNTDSFIRRIYKKNIKTLISQNTFLGY